MPNGDDQKPIPVPDDDAVLHTSIGSGLLARATPPTADHTIAVAKVCPQCASEYETSDRFCPKDGSPLRPKSVGDPLVGRVIADRYLVLARLGQGGMGRVYLAEHVKMARQCAIKVMNPSLIHDTNSAARFAREASNAARILHSNVAAVFDYGEADKIVYLVMEYVDGESLSTLLAREGAIEPLRAIEIARQIADGLAAAHELGIVHRDLKPDNVIITRNRAGKEIPKVVDFGIAKALTDTPEDALTRSGLVIGTPEYMSPEQLLGDPVDARADIYSLGCILYQMLTGEQAFAAESREQMIRRRLHETPPHVRDIMPTLPRRLDTLIVHMLARSPGDRLLSAAGARDALDPVIALGGWEPPPVRTSGPRQGKTVMMVSGPPADPALQPTMPIKRQRTSIKRVVVGAVVGSAAMFGGLVLWSSRQALIATFATTLVQPPAKQDTTPAVPQQTPAVVPETTRAPVKHDAAKIDSSALHVPKPPDIPPDEKAVRRALGGFAKAIESGKIEVVVQKFPAMPEASRDRLASFMASAEHIRATSTFGPATISGDSAEVPFTVNLKFTYLATGQTTTSKLPYRATLARHGNAWDIGALSAVP